MKNHKVMNYFDFTNREILNGLAHLADRMKIHVHNENNSLFELLEFQDDTVFLEPLLFAHFFSKTFNKPINSSLDEILVGYIKPAFLKNRTFRCFVNEEGVLYIPNYGHLLIPIKNSFIELSFNSQQQVVISYQGNQIDYSFEEVIKLGDTNIEICICSIRVLIQTTQYQQTAVRCVCCLRA